METTEGEQYLGVREFAAAYSSVVGRKVHPSTITRAVQAGRIQKRDDGKIPLTAGLRAMEVNTDPVAQLGFQVRDSLPFDEAPTHTPSTLTASPGGAGAAPTGSINAIKTAEAAIRLQQAQLDLAERQGAVALVDPLKAAFARQLAGMVGQIEVALPDLAQQLGDQLGCERHEVLVELRRWWRDMRVSMASTARAQGEALPDLVVDASADPADDDAADDDETTETAE
ncbi:hypothetical protein [Azospirillum picis]|uniref:Terminase small subunit n=1 Tax=Azospirillum picis TaxID=488438 RepID=A0ABU0MUJ6_9PROT|nr:hypothetical protein [Azospirillum picis]MBP2303315.1 hypothetical protein [Azospirillum picis]MDQ0537145.1 hypothetical protein [Azospirillum picis]